MGASGTPEAPVSISGLSKGLEARYQEIPAPQAQREGLAGLDHPPGTTIGPRPPGRPRGARGHSMDVRFWGTRGSVAKPGPTTLRYGGNTSCVEVRGVDGTLIVLDCGTGAHGLGQALVSAGGPRCDGHLMITHTHWDHIQGFPFFAPLFIPGNTWDIYAPGALGQQLERTLAGQMEYNYFPVTLAQLGASIRFHDLAEGRFTVGAVRVTTQYLNHPALALGYRLQSGGNVVVYSVDHEPHAPHPAARSQGSRPSTARTSVTSNSSPTQTWSFTTLSTRSRSIRRRRAGVPRPPRGGTATRRPTAPGAAPRCTTARSGPRPPALPACRACAG